MIIIISGTNRPGSNTRKVTSHVESVYATLGIPAQVLDLADLPPEIFLPSAYEKSPASFKKLIDAILLDETGLFTSPDVEKRLANQAAGFVGFVEKLHAKNL